LSEGPGATRADAPDGDPVEEVWKTYYASIFNPARVKVKAMTKEMPKKYWKNMPETALVGELIAGAQAREAGWWKRHEGRSATMRWRLGSGPREAMGCTRCHLYKCGTQTVFGEGPLECQDHVRRRAAGRPGGSCRPPFVGPAGQLFDRALARRALTARKPTSPMPSSTSSSSARQEAHPPEAGSARNPGLPLVDRTGTHAYPPADNCRARRHRRPLALRQGGDHLLDARPPAAGL
jgi:hypothetical protein